MRMKLNILFYQKRFGVLNSIECSTLSILYIHLFRMKEISLKSKNWNELIRNEFFWSKFFNNLHLNVSHFNFATAFIQSGNVNKHIMMRWKVPWKLYIEIYFPLIYLLLCHNNFRFVVNEYRLNTWLLFPTFAILYPFLTLFFFFVNF